EGVARVADQRDLLTGTDPLTLGNQELAGMSVQGLHLVAVVENHAVAVPAVPAGQLHDAVVRRIYRSAVRGGEVDARVQHSPADSRHLSPAAVVAISPDH